jgi:hypothetical protein
MDFVKGLLTSEGITCLIVITNCLGKGLIFILLLDIKTEIVV